MPLNYLNTNEEAFRSIPVLFRILPLERALQALDERALWFSNPLAWSDPFERHYLDAKYRVGKQERNLPLKNRLLCLCLSGTYSCEAFWQVYAPGEVGIGLTIDLKALVRMLESLDGYGVYVGAADYRSTRYITGYAASHKQLLQRVFDRSAGDTYPDQLRLMLLKRRAFEYENETRVLLVRAKESAARGELIPFGDTPLVSRLTLDPRLGKRTADLLRDSFRERYGIPVARSLIYQELPTKRIKL